MMLDVRWLNRLIRMSLAVTFALLVSAGMTAAQNGGKPYHLSASVSGGAYPIISGSTDLPEGKSLFVLLKKPWLPDGQQRIARGLPACGDDCYPAEGSGHLLGVTTKIKNGTFTAGPFSFKGEPFKPGTYPLEISLSVDLKTATLEEIHAIGTLIYSNAIQVTPDKVILLRSN